MSDGTSIGRSSFSPEDAAAFEESLQTAQGWHAPPLDNDVRYLLYGTEGIEKAQDGAYISVNPYLTGKDGGPLFPKVEEGYWFFCDEQTESYTAQGVMERPSPKLHRRCLRQPEPHPLLRGIGHIKACRKGHPGNRGCPFFHGPQILFAAAPRASASA